MPEQALLSSIAPEAAFSVAEEPASSVRRKKFTGTERAAHYVAPLQIRRCHPAPAATGPATDSRLAPMRASCRSVAQGVRIGGDLIGGWSTRFLRLPEGARAGRLPPAPPEAPTVSGGVEGTVLSALDRGCRAAVTAPPGPVDGAGTGPIEAVVRWRGMSVECTGRGLWASNPAGVFPFDAGVGSAVVSSSCVRERFPQFVADIRFIVDWCFVGLPCVRP